MLKVLVAGATGRQGGAVAKALVERGHQVRAVTRDPSSATAVALADLGAEIVVAGLEDEEALRRCAAGVDAMFGVTIAREPDNEGEVRQGKAQANAALAAGVRHFVFTSAGSTDRGTGLPSFETKRQVELYAEAIGLPTTVLGPTFFMDNIFHPQYLPNLRQGELTISVRPDTVIQLIACEDIAAVAARVMEDPDTYAGRRFDLASDALTGPEMAEIVGAATGRPLNFRPFRPDEGVRAYRGLIFEWLDEGGFDVDIPKLKSTFPDVEWRTFASYVAAQNIKPLTT